MERDPFFTNVQSWSKRKHRLLANYLRPFSAKVGSIAPVIHCVDGFAGAGKYKDGSEGSPLLIARAADQCATWANPVTLRLINVEANRKNFKSLEASTAPWVDQGIVRNLRGRFGSRIQEVVSLIGNDPAFFFIDPYGPGPIHFEFIKPILTRTAITELIINFDADGLMRMADLIRATPKTESVKKGCETSVANVTKILGSERWQQTFLDITVSAVRRQKFLVRDYMGRLVDSGFKVVAYPIRDSASAPPKYYLIYCTRHRDGIALMNGFIRREEDMLLRESYERNGQAMLFDPVDADISLRRRELRNLIVTYSEEKRRTTRAQLKHHFIQTRFAEFHETDYNAVVQELIQSGVLSTTTGKKRINDDVGLMYVPPDNFIQQDTTVRT